MEEKRNIVNFEEVLDGEITDIWDTIFSVSRKQEDHLSEIKEKMNMQNKTENVKPRRYMKFLFM